MAAILYFIIYISNIIFISCINAEKDYFVEPILKKILPTTHYEKLFADYNINIQLKNNKINKEFLINTSYFSNNFFFDYSYSGKLFCLNESNMHLLSTDYYRKNKVLLIRSNTTFNNYIIQNKPLFKNLAKVIIVPKNSITNIDIIARYIFYELSIVLIELDEDIFNTLEMYGENSKINIISKKIDVFPFKLLYLLILTISIFLFFCSVLYRFLTKIYKRNYSANQISFFQSVNYNISFKILILLLLYIDLNLFFYMEGIIIEYTSFIKSVLIFLMIINKAGTIVFLLKIYYGVGINMKGDKLSSTLIWNLSGLFCVFYILFNIFINPLKIPQAFYILSLFISIPIFIEMIYFSMKNIFFLFRALFQIWSIKKYYEKYGPTIRLKIYIVFIQLIILLIYGYSYFFIQKYILFKKGLCFTIEKDILFQSLESIFIFIISIIYIPRKWPEGYGLYILMIHNSKKTSKIKISGDDDYSSSIPLNELDSEENIKSYVRKNIEKDYVILNPRVFLEKNRNNIINDNNDEEKDIKNSFLGNKVKLGKLIRT